MPSLISVLSSHGSSRIAHALNKESRSRPNAAGANAIGGDSAPIKLPASLSLLFGPAAPSFYQEQQQPAPLGQFQQRFHQQYLPQLPIPRGFESQYTSAKPAEHSGLHLICGGGFDFQSPQHQPREHASSNAAVLSSTSSDAADESTPSTLPLADLILDYLEEEEIDEGSTVDAWDFATIGGCGDVGGTTSEYSHMVHSTTQSSNQSSTRYGTQAQYYGMDTALAPAEPGAQAARLGLKPAHRLLGDGFLVRQMESTAHDQLRIVQSLATTTNPLETALYADVISAMSDARLCHVDALKSSSDISSSSPASQGLGGSALNAVVAGRLRAMGYDAAVCTTQWDSSPTVPEGTYEYIDVLVADVPSTDLSTVDLSTPKLASSRSTLLAFTSPAQACVPPAVTVTTSPIPAFASATSASPLPAYTSAPCTSQRFIVDLGFCSQFQIARPTCEYTAVIESTPLIFVGRQERVARLVEVVSDAIVKSTLRKILYSVK